MGNKSIALTTDNFEAEVLNFNGVALVDFWAPWCGPCRMVGPVIEELAEEYEKRVKVCKINVDEEGELAAKYGVMSIPTIIIFKDGKVLNKAVGARGKEEFKQMLEEAI